MPSPPPCWGRVASPASAGDGRGRPHPSFVTDEQSLPFLSDADLILEISSSIGLVDSDVNSSIVSRPFNIQTEHSPSGNLIELDLPKDADVYNSKSFMKMLKKYELPPGYLYRVPNPSERIPGSDPRKVVVYRNSMTAGLRFTLHPLFVSCFNEFHVTPGQLTPNCNVPKIRISILNMKKENEMRNLVELSQKVEKAKC
ncbi:Uncharacterized protein Adt_38536 [Abeliophyllum distichum]|uniref:Uncharacterized protein n=1 Tax=Abeliophyllum distichum TaxID=126358 RepID=A0ABD1Q2J7_9LAMI